METIVSYLQNKLLSSGVKHAIESSNPNIMVETATVIEGCSALCRGIRADAFIAEVRDTYPLTLNDWYVIIDEIKQIRKDCKIILVVDEETYPKSAQEINKAYKEKKIDLFFYCSSGLNYLADTINNM